MPPLGPSAGARSWARSSGRVALGLLAVLAGLTLFLWLMDRLVPWQQIGLGVALAVVELALLYRLSGRSLLGPILFYDLIRSARHGRHALLRCGFLVVLLVMLSLLYFEWFSGTRARARALAGTGAGFSGQSDWTGGQLSPNELAQFAEAFFETFMGVLFVVVVVVTPA